MSHITYAPHPLSNSWLRDCLYWRCHKAQFKRRTFHVPNLMLVSKILCTDWFVFGLTHEKFDVWTGPKSCRNMYTIKYFVVYLKFICKLQKNLVPRNVGHFNSDGFMGQNLALQWRNAVTYFPDERQPSKWGVENQAKYVSWSNDPHKVLHILCFIFCHDIFNEVFAGWPLSGTKRTF